VFAIKVGPNGIIDRLKARLMAKARLKARLKFLGWIMEIPFPRG